MDNTHFLSLKVLYLKYAKIRPMRLQQRVDQLCLTVINIPQGFLSFFSDSHFPSLSPAPSPPRRTWAPRKHGLGIASQGGNIHQPWHQSPETPQNASSNLFAISMSFSEASITPVTTTCYLFRKARKGKGGRVYNQPELLIFSYYFYSPNAILYKHYSRLNHSALPTDTSATKQLHLWD